MTGLEQLAFIRVYFASRPCPFCRTFTSDSGWILENKFQIQYGLVYGVQNYCIKKRTFESVVQLPPLKQLCAEQKTGGFRNTPANWDSLGWKGDGVAISGGIKVGRTMVTWPDSRKNSDGLQV